MNIDTRILQAELQELCGNEQVTIKLDKALPIACRISETDTAYRIYFNPNRFKNQQKLDNMMDWCRQTVTQD